MNMAAKKYLHDGDNTAFSDDSGEVVEPCASEKIVRAGRFGKPNVKQ